MLIFQTILVTLFRNFQKVPVDSILYNKVSQFDLVYFSFSGNIINFLSSSTVSGKKRFFCKFSQQPLFIILVTTKTKRVKSKKSYEIISDFVI